MRNPCDDEEREAREAWSAYRDFKVEQIRRAGVPWHTLTASFEAARLVQRAFYAGWRGRKVAALKTGCSLKAAEALIRAFLADGPRSSSAVQTMAEAANIRWAVICRAASVLGVQRSKSKSLWIWSLPTIEEDWSLPTFEEELADTGLFFDAGIPIG